MVLFGVYKLHHILFLSGLFKHSQSKPGTKVGNPLHCVYILFVLIVFESYIQLGKSIWCCGLLFWYCFTKRTASINSLIISSTKNVENVHINEIDMSVRVSAVQMRLICTKSIFLCSSLEECTVKANMITDK